MDGQAGTDGNENPFFRFVESRPSVTNIMARQPESVW